MEGDVGLTEETPVSRVQIDRIPARIARCLHERLSDGLHGNPEAAIGDILHGQPGGCDSFVYELNGPGASFYGCHVPILPSKNTIVSRHEDDSLYKYKYIP